MTTLKTRNLENDKPEKDISEKELIIQRKH